MKKSNINLNEYECQKIDSINFHFYEPITIYGIDMIENDEMCISFWLNIYEYIPKQFEKLRIIWDYHMGIEI